jgi:hypothetical protein
MNQNTTQEDVLITFVNAFLDGELLTLPELHRAECEALASVVGVSPEQRAGILQNIRLVPKYKAFDELLKRRLDPQPDTPQERPYQLHPLSYYKNRPPKEWATEKFILSTNAQLAEAHVTPNTHSLLIVFDTYSKCTPGSDENNTKDVKGIVEQIDRVCVEMNAHVLIICHTNSDGMVKGNKALRDGVDTVWMVDKENETIRLTNDKMRGAPEPQPLYACMRPIILDEHNLHHTAPVIFAMDEKDGSLQFTPNTHIKMLSVLQENGKMSTSNWQKQCETVHRIKRTSFFQHLKKLRADQLVSEPSEGINNRKAVDYSITEKGLEFLEDSLK